MSAASWSQVQVRSAPTRNRRKTAALGERPLRVETTKGRVEKWPYAAGASRVFNTLIPPGAPRIFHTQRPRWTPPYAAMGGLTP